MLKIYGRTAKKSVPPANRSSPPSQASVIVNADRHSLASCLRHALELHRGYVCTTVILAGAAWALEQEGFPNVRFTTPQAYYSSCVGVRDRRADS